MADRRMVYPYTFPGKIAQFPFKFYYENSKFFKFYIWSIFISLPVFWKLQKLSCSEANYLRLEQYRKKEAEEFEAHKEHLLVLNLHNDACNGWKRLKNVLRWYCYMLGITKDVQDRLKQILLESELQKFKVKESWFI